MKLELLERQRVTDGRLRFSVGTIGAVALLTIAGAFLWAIFEELEDMRDLLITYADAIRVRN